MDFIKLTIGESQDFKIHEFAFGEHSQFLGALVYIDGLVNTIQITESILKPIVLNGRKYKSLEDELTISEIRRSVLCSGSVVESNLFSQIVDGCLSGSTIMLLDSFSKALIINTELLKKRCNRTSTETVIRGPREGFTENLRTNTTLLRRRIKSSKFRMEHMTIGHKTATNVCIAYIEGVAKPEIIELLKTRLNSINVDAVLDSGYIEEYIEESPFSIFFYSRI